MFLLYLAIVIVHCIDFFFSREKEFKVTIKCAGAANLYMHSLKQFLAGRQRELPQDTIQALDIALRECPSSR